MEIGKELVDAVATSEDYDSLTATYILLRDGLEDAKRAATLISEPMVALQKTIEGKLLGMLQESGVESVRTASGTVFKTPKTSARVADWNVLLDYIKKNDAFDLLTKNVSKDAVKARIEESKEIVPGVDMVTFVSVGIRRR